MEYRNLGRSGLKVSELCLGTMTFGHGTDEATAKQMVDLAFESGVNFFDTANTYGAGLSEIMLGKALKGRRREAVVATKFFNPTGPGPNDSGLSRVAVMQSVEDSLRRLQMDWIDIYYMHHVDTQTPLDETLRALDDLVRQGKVRYIACSNYEAWRTMEALWISDSRNWSRFICYQPQYSLIVRDIELELIPMFQYKGLGTVVWGPLAGGFLSGKYLPGQRVLAGTRSEEKWVFPEPLPRRRRRRDPGNAARGRRRAGAQPVAGGDPLGAGAAGGQLRHRGRAHHRAVARQPGRRGVAPARRRPGSV